ncbi:hypothetical protein ACOMHN_022596 [Nucella lapillus]
MAETVNVSGTTLWRGRYGSLTLLLLILLSDPFCLPALTQTPTPSPPLYHTNSSTLISSTPSRVTVAGVAPLQPGSAESPGGGGGGGGGSNLCRDRLGSFPPEEFQLWTCGFCLSYLYTSKPIHVHFHHRLRLLIFTNATKHPVSMVRPDVTNATDVSKVCGALEAAGQDCQRWQDCCQAARNCCDHQLAMRNTPTTEAGSSSGGEEKNEEEGVEYCPATWDGYRCWEATPPGSTVSTHCASYIEHATPDGESPG